MMLLLSRKANESIFIGDDIEIIVSRIDGNRVKIAVVAPTTTKILRGELKRDFHGTKKL